MSRVRHAGHRAPAARGAGVRVRAGGLVAEQFIALIVLKANFSPRKGNTASSELIPPHMKVGRYFFYLPENQAKDIICQCPVATSARTRGSYRDLV